MTEPDRFRDISAARHVIHDANALQVIFQAVLDEGDVGRVREVTVAILFVGKGHKEAMRETVVEGRPGLRKFWQKRD